MGRGLALLVDSVLIIQGWVPPVQGEGESRAFIKVETDTYDFGRVLQGDVVTHDFMVFNIGTAPLTIEGVRPY